MSVLKKFNQFINENHDGEHHNEEDHAQNYMFFGNLQTIKRLVDMLLEMDPAKIDNMIKNGHDWASDHLATSKDDIEEVFNFFKGELDGADDLDQMSKDQMEHDDMMLRREQGI